MQKQKGKYFSIFKSDILKEVPKSNNNNLINETQYYRPSLLQALITGVLAVKYDENKAIFINRDSKYFNYILNYLRVANTSESFSQPCNLNDLKCLLKESEFYQMDGLTDLLNKTLNSQTKTKSFKKSIRNRKKLIESSSSSSTVEISIQRKNKSPIKKSMPKPIQSLVKPVANLEISDAINEKNALEASSSKTNSKNPGRIRSFQNTCKENPEKPTTTNGAGLTFNSDHPKPVVNLDDRIENTPYLKTQNPSSNKTNESKEARSIDALIDLYSVYTRDKSKEHVSNYFSDSVILNKKLAKELIKLCEFSLNDKWVLLYRGTQHGFGSQDFHKRCDNYTKTLTLVKSNTFIFGGYSSASWDENDQYKSDSNAFLFSLVNKDNKPIKMKCQNAHNSIYCSSTSSAVFGGGHDLYISNNSNTNTTSYSNLGHSYEHPKHKYDTSEVSSFLAGSFNFKVSEIEIYYKI